MLQVVILDIPQQRSKQMVPKDILTKHRRYVTVLNRLQLLVYA